MRKRLLTTAVATLTIHYCGQCPLHTTAYRRERVTRTDEYPQRFTSVIDYHKCPKTGRRVQFTTIDEKCPLPFAPESTGLSRSADLEATR